MQKIDFSKIKRIHFIGVGGIGLSAIAKLMKARGKIISGSDANKSEITEELKKTGAKIVIGQKAENLANDTELVIYTLAIPKNNSERVKAEKLKILMLAYPEALAMLFNPKYGIAICGTHGKSTVTSMIGLVLAGGGLDPSVVVGSKVPEFTRFGSSESRRGGNLRIGKGKSFVIEACEYERAFLEYYPKIIILNNIELDHTDYYKDIEDYRSAFEEFIGHLPKDGVLIMNGDDKIVQSSKFKVQSFNSKFKILKFGFGKNNDLRCRKMKIGEGETRFWASFNNKDLGEFTLKIPGKFNVYNALAAIAAGLHLGIGAEKIKKSLADFGGIWRRFEIKGEYEPAVAEKLWRGKGATVISDYAHHPTAVKATIEAGREFYPGRRIFAVFQPHQHNRTKMLYKDFLKSFNSADALILAEIFDVAGREDKKDQNVSSRKMTEDIKKRIFLRQVFGGQVKNENPPSSLYERGDECERRETKISPFGKGGLRGISALRSDNIFYASNLVETRKLIDEKIRPRDILLIMGAGDIYKVADELVKE